LLARALLALLVVAGLGLLLEVLALLDDGLEAVFLADVVEVVVLLDVLPVPEAEDDRAVERLDRLVLLVEARVAAREVVLRVLLEPVLPLLRELGLLDLGDDLLIAAGALLVVLAFFELLRDRRELLVDRLHLVVR